MAEITPQIDYTKINKDIADYVVSAGKMINKLFPEKKEEYYASVKLDKHFKDVFLDKFGKEILYNSIVFAYSYVNIDSLTIDIYKKRLLDLEK